MRKVVKKKGQVWIETVIYTMIAFVILGAVLSFAKPKIEELQDKAIIGQSLDIMENINNIINNIKDVPGNKRAIELGIKKGSLTIDGKDNLIVFNIDSKYMYSEPGKKYKEGDTIIYNTQIGDINKLSATINCSAYNITWMDESKIETLGQSSAPYNLFISNKGNNQINFEFK